MKKKITSILAAVIGAAAGAAAVGKLSVDNSRRIQTMSDKYLALFLMMNQWVKVKQEGKCLVEFFEKKGYKRIAIYGMSYAGETLANELKNTDVEVVYGIDKNVDSVYSNVDIVSVEDDLKPVDAIVVTAITFFNEIEEQLAQKVKCPILSLEDILYEV